MMNERKVAVVGCGAVGASIAFSLMQSRLYSEMVLIDVNTAKAEGEAMANELFKREDFPSVNIGKTKTVTLLAYLKWKMERRL